MQEPEFKISLFAGLKKYFDSGKRLNNIIEIEKEISLEELLIKLKIPEDEISTIVVNYKIKNKKYQLKNGDKVYLFPPIVGG